MTPYELVKQHYELPFELRQYQIDDVNRLGPIQAAGYYYDQGCVDKDTEYLSETGWVKISEYTGGKVAQYNLDGTIEFVYPTQYVKLPCLKMIHFKTQYGVDQMLSPEHRVLSTNPFTNEQSVISAMEVYYSHHRLKMGFRGKFPTTYKVKNNTKLDLSDDELRVMVAVIADGYFASPSSHSCTIRVKKDRKKERLMWLLAEAGIEYTYTIGNVPSNEGFAIFRFKSPWHTKEFGIEFWQASQEQLEIIADECGYWDGSFTGSGGMVFSTSSKASAEFIQYAISATGKRASLKYRFRERAGRGSSHEYTVIRSEGDPRVGISGAGHTKPNRAVCVDSPDGFKYCFMVPSTFLLFRRNGNIFASGNTGKTATATASTLYKFINGSIDHCIVVVPPILIQMWYRWLTSIPNLSVVAYKGTPAQRAKIDIRAQFIIMSMNIFKSDIDYIQRKFRGRDLNILVDEASNIKNVSSGNFKTVRDFSHGQHLMLLTGTPMTKPVDCYAFCKLIAPHLYRNMSQFANLHVDKVDFFNNPISWKNLDLLKENMQVNSTRVLREEVLKDLPPVQYIPIHYELEPAHRKLYYQLAEEQIIALESGGKIDATQASALYHALQQIVINYDYFSDNPKNVSSGLDLVDEVMEELGDDGKLVIFSNYRMTNRTLLRRLAKYNVVAAFGDNSAAQNQKNIDKFINDPRCRGLIGQPSSMGYGVDGLQKVCNDMLFLETPVVPRDFHQSVARLWRGGQSRPVNIRIAIAEGTCQVRLHKNLLNNDELVNKVQGGFRDLRDSIYGK